jgi:hypothetical protein
MFATAGACTKEVMSRGGWKSIVMVARYEHASEGAARNQRKRSASIQKTRTWCRSGRSCCQVGTEAEAIAQAACSPA